MASRTGNSRLSVDEWIAAGYALIAEAGLQALKIDRLCERLNVTRGSFYWHFTDMISYRQALIESWAEQRGAEHEVYRQIRGHPPRERLSMLMVALVVPRHWRLERAMREWARTDKTVAASVAAADRRVLEVVQQAFTEIGFSPDEARVRAWITFAAGLGFLQLTTPRAEPMSKISTERFLDFMLRP